MGTTILRLDSANAIDGNLYQMDSADEQWIAYQSGIRIADYLSGDFLGNDLSSAPYSLNTSGGNNIGTFNDTRETAADSSDPSSIATVSTTVYQTSGKVNLSPDRRYPVDFVSGTPNQLTEMDSSEVDTIAGRLKEYLFDSDNHWAGVIKLASSAPSAEYTLIDSAFADTIGNPATTNQYNFYVKNYVTSGDSASIPSESRPVSLKRSSGITGTFQGLQEMSDSNIGETFGRAVMSNVVATTNGIGTYQLRSATQGAPTASGTWKPMGTATDTRRTVTAVVNYAGARVSTYETVRTSEYTSTSTRTRTSTYTRTSTRTRTSAYTRTSTRTSARTRTSAYTRTSTRTRSSTYTRNRVVNYTGNFARSFAGNFSRTFVGNFSRTFVGNFAGNFTGDFLRTNAIYGAQANFQRTSTRTSIRNRVQAYTRNDVTAYGRTSVVSYTRTSSVTFTGNYARNFAGDYVGNFSRNFAGDYVGDYVGNFTRDFAGDYVGNFTRDFAGDYLGNYTRDFAGTFTRDFARISTRNVLESGSSQVIETYTLYLRCA